VTSKTPRVLVVEDDDDVREILMTMVRHLGYEASGAVDGRDGLQTFGLQQDSIDLVITDVSMPEMSGIELLEALHGQQPKTPVVLLTAHDLSLEFSTYAALGAKGWIHKPVNLSELERVLADAIAP